MNDLGRRLRDIERAEQHRQRRLALNLFECGEIRQRDAERRWQATAGGGEQIGLFVNGQEDVDRAACDHVEHGGEIALGVASAGGRRMDAGDEARESRQAHRVARNRLDAESRQAESRRRLARREARAFAQKDSATSRGHAFKLAWTPISDFAS